MTFLPKPRTIFQTENLQIFSRRRIKVEEIRDEKCQSGEKYNHMTALNSTTSAVRL